MDNKTIQIFQCENDDCGLRFPGFENYPKWNRCPRCRAKLQIVSTITKQFTKTEQTTPPQIIPVEILLDNIRSALNVGSIFRTADGTGIRKIYNCGITPTPDTLKVKKTSLGAEETIQWEHSRNGLFTAQSLKAKGYYLWALEDTPTSQNMFSTELAEDNQSIVLIVGNEIAGVDPGILEICDRVIKIPMLGRKRSYNVAIALSIAANYFMYHYFYRQSN